MSVARSLFVDGGLLSSAEEAEWVAGEAGLDVRVASNGDWAVVRDEAFRAWREVRRINGALASCDLASGRGLRRLVREIGLAKLGHSSPEDFATGRLSGSWSHWRELISIATALQTMPLMRAAFVAGELPRAKVRQLIRVATTATDAAWTQFGRRSSSRAIEREVRAQLAARARDEERAVPVMPDGVEGCVQVSWVSGVEDAYTWRAYGREMLRTVLGGRFVDGKLLEALCQETLSDLGGGRHEQPEGMRAGSPGAPKVRGGMAARLARRGRRLRARSGPPLLEVPDVDSPTEAWPLLRRMLQVERLRTVLEYQRVRWLRRIRDQRLDLQLGFRSFDQYHDALGLAPRETHRACQLLEQVEKRPRLRHAWATGEIPSGLVARLLEVATTRTDDDWIAHARRATPKRLDVEIELHQNLAHVMGEAAYLALTDGRPIAEMTLRQLLPNWTTGLGIEVAMGMRPAQRKAEEDFEAESEEGVRAATLLPADVDAKAWRGMQISVRCSRDVASLFREAIAGVRAGIGPALSVAQCMSWMIRHFASTHASFNVVRLTRRHRAMSRDGWLCQMPHCRRMADLHEHHVKFRSQGGSDDPSNLATLCVHCHRLVHEGYVRITGTASDDLVFELGLSPGRDPTEETYMRELRRLAA